MSDDGAARIRRRQQAFYTGVEDARFRWLSEHPYVRRAEARLLRHVPIAPHESILEVGCGEGAGLVALRRLGFSVSYVGFDCFLAKVRFCREQHRDAAFCVADARHGFPFAAERFDRVLVRDVLHHLASTERERLVRESLRVLKPKGTLSIIEGNANNRVGRIFAVIFPHERGMLETRSHLLVPFVQRSVADCAVSVEMEEPSNVFRLLLHYRFGWPALGRMALPARLLDAWQAAARRLVPERRWAYAIVTVVKSGARSEPVVDDAARR